jgi:hypothetical protein
VWWIYSPAEQSRLDQSLLDQTLVMDGSLGRAGEIGRIPPSQPQRILASEFQRDLQAERVVEAIGHGETAHGRIADRSGVKGNTLTAALDVLAVDEVLGAGELLDAWRSAAAGEGS